MITRKKTFRKIPRTFLFFMMLLHGSVTCSFSNSPNPMLERLELSQKLDSLEVEKQSLKRQGKSIAELERTTKNIRNSLAALRHVPAPPPRTSPTPDTLPFGPRSTFDWIIIATGLVAAISGIILIIGMLRTRREKRRRMSYTYTRRLQPVNKPVKKTDAEAEEQKRPFIPPVTEQSRTRTEPKRESPSEVISDQNRTESSDNGLITTLRERLSQDTRPEENRSSRPVIPETPPKTNPMSFNDLVIHSANEGLSVQEISRRYQISIDQVTLILKIAGQK